MRIRRSHGLDRARRLQALATACALAVVASAACDATTPEGDGSIARRDAIAGDGPVSAPAIVESPAGRVDLGPALEHRVTEDGAWLSVLAPQEQRAWTGELRVGPPDALVTVLDDVARGLAGCEARPRRLAVARSRDGDPGARDLWIVDGTSPRRHALPGHTLDRVFGLSPDGRWALIVTRAGGLPVIAAVDLEGDAGVRALANHDLSYEPGTKPEGFTPPPVFPYALRWDDARRFRYPVAEADEVRLALPAVAEVRP